MDLQIFAGNDGYTVRDAVTFDEIETLDSAGTALSAALGRLSNSGGSIHLYSGIYDVREQMTVPSHVRIQGSGPMTVIRYTGWIDAAAVGAESMFLVMGAEYVEICDLTIIFGADVTPQAGLPATSRGPGAPGQAPETRTGEGPDAEPIGWSGIIIDNSGYCKVRNVIVNSFPGFGVWMRNSSFLCAVENSRFGGNERSAIYCDSLGKGRVGDWVPNTVAGCIIAGGGYGIQVRQAIVLNIVGCAVFQSRNHAFYVRDHSNSVLISGCRSYQIEADSVVVDDSHEVNISSNIFCWHRGHGIVLTGAKWGSVTGNNVIDSGVRSEVRKDGITLSNETEGIQISGNSVFNWGDQVPMAVGIREDETCRNNGIVANNINFCDEAVIVASGWGTKVEGNIEEKDLAYVGMGRKPYPDFTRSRLDVFLMKSFSSPA